MLPSIEAALIARLRGVAMHPAARGLLDDAAVLSPPLGRDLVFTHDMLAAGVHFIGDEPPETLAAKLVAVNLSDLAAMGARPLGLLLGVALSPRENVAWADAFVVGLAEACARWGAPLLGGDTIAGVDRLVLGLTAIGAVEPGQAVARAGAAAGDLLWVTGNIGDAGLGLAVARGELDFDAALLARYRMPEPRLAFGLGLAVLASAAIDISDGLLLDAERLAAASGVALRVDLARLPISRAAEALGADPLMLATSGDDYELLFTAPAAATEALTGYAHRHKLRLTAIGEAAPGHGLAIFGPDGHAVTPARLGYQHGAT